MEFHAYTPTRVLFGAGQLNNLRNQKMLGNKALIIISQGTSAKVNGYLGRVEEQLALANVQYVIFDQVEANPLNTTVMSAGKFARENDCDFIVVLGGGSCLDASKAIATMATNSGDIWDYVSGGTGKGLPIMHDPLPIIAITTTAGTGSEVDAWGVISNLDTNEKIGFGGDDRLFPKLAIVDPELMLTVPPKFTAYQGFDALFHSTEVYISKFANSMSDMVARTAIEKIGESLACTVKDGSNLEARTNVAFANTMSGYAMVTASTTSEHSLEHAMSAYHHELPHGAGLIMISEAYYQFFIDSHCCDDRFVNMAKFLGNKNASKAQDFITELVTLQKACGVADLKMSDYGITPAEFGTLADNAKETMGGLFQSDRITLSKADCVKILMKSFK